MDELQRLIEENLPDRFKNMKMFRIPVKNEGILYWASFNNGVWNFQKAMQAVNPLLTFGEEPPKTSNAVLEDTVEEIIEETPKAPVKERPSKEKPVREKPSKEKPTKERPVREKPVKEVKERPVRETKEKPIRETKQKPMPKPANDFDGDLIYSEPIDGDSMNCSFVNKNKPMKPLTGRFVFCLLLFIFSLGSTALTTIPVIVNCSKAKSHLNNPVEYWHYRSKTTYLFALNVISVIIGAIIGTIIGLILVLAPTMLMGITQMIFGV